MTGLFQNFNSAMPFLLVLFWLVIGHAFADYALQSDFMAKAKNYKLNPAKREWIIVLMAHCLIHAGFVLAITGFAILAAFEIITHFIIDTAKCAGKLTLFQDQFLHLACKVLIAFAYVNATALPQTFLTA